ncbi:hypothetical protein SRB17_57980 [Streptomyces sp. RB17]|uniref:hypothetical protein n=1 Tax=Streptomyces sp. RB17 TaxID=2585197 RepID=UPI00130A2690|nr:hypothetical protein [Streptomyces sp. RB17]MQY37793.1 hypothetical protein [Streptomyces sp. RB17]
MAANGQSVLAAYAPVPGGGHALHTVQVLTVTGGRVARNVVFAGPRVLAAFAPTAPAALLRRHGPDGDPRSFFRWER